MTAAGAKGDPLGRVYTPLRVATVILELLEPLLPAGPVSVVDPCLGGGAFVEASRTVLGARVRHTLGVDIDPKAPGRTLVDSFVVGDVRRLPALRPLTLSVTNPPWGKAVSQPVTLAIVSAVRSLGEVSAVIVPVEYLSQVRWSAHVEAASHVWPIQGRVWSRDRGMMVLVWGAARSEANRFRRITGGPWVEESDDE